MSKEADEMRKSTIYTAATEAYKNGLKREEACASIGANMPSLDAAMIAEVTDECYAACCMRRDTFGGVVRPPCEDLVLDKADGIKCTAANVARLFESDVQLKDTIRLNEMNGQIEVYERSPVWLDSTRPSGTPLTSDVEWQVFRTWLTRREKAGYVVRDGGMETIMAGVYSAAWQHRYHPLQDFLRLCEWDGVPRVDQFFNSICGLPVNDYYIGCGKIMFLALIERAFNPGTQMFTVVTFISPQGWGKSRLLKTLGDPWFMDTHLDLSNRDALMQIMGQWIVELSELASVRKTELEHLKGFLSSTKDFFRVPYGRTATFFPRSCVFFGTSNDMEFLTDSENRRWLPIQIPKPIDVAWVEKHRTQLFGEAFASYVKGARWLDVYHAIVKPQQVVQQEKFTFTDERVHLIQRWLNEPDAPPKFTLAELLTAVFPKEKMDVSTQKVFGNLLRRAGCDKRQERVPGTQERPTFWYRKATEDQPQEKLLPPAFPAITADQIPDVE